MLLASRYRYHGGVAAVKAAEGLQVFCRTFVEKENVETHFRVYRSAKSN